ncbi:MAG: hypothetical protein ABI809_00230 [Caldimonas sp.]
MSAVLPSPMAVPASDRTEAALSAPKPEGVTGALERLALSREILRAAMLPAPPKAHAHALGDGIGALTSGLVDRVKTMPGAAVLIDTLRSWWDQHPLRTAGLVAAEASRKIATPVAERNPLGLVLGAVVVGALFALSRPWRWMLKPALFAGLLPALALRAIRELPVDSWLKMFASLAAPGTARAVPVPVPVPATPDARNWGPTEP